MLGIIEVEGGAKVSEFSDPNERNLVVEVSITEPRVFGRGIPVKVWRRVSHGIVEHFERKSVCYSTPLELTPWFANATCMSNTCLAGT